MLHVPNLHSSNIPFHSSSRRGGAKRRYQSTPHVSIRVQEKNKENIPSTLHVPRQNKLWSNIPTRPPHSLENCTCTLPPTTHSPTDLLLYVLTLHHHPRFSPHFRLASTTIPVLRQSIVSLTPIRRLPPIPTILQLHHPTKAMRLSPLQKEKPHQSPFKLAHFSHPGEIPPPLPSSPPSQRPKSSFRYPFASLSHYYVYLTLLQNSCLMCHFLTLILVSIHC